MKTLPKREADRNARIDRLLRGDSRLSTAAELERQTRDNRAAFDKLTEDCHVDDETDSHDDAS